MSSDNRPFPSAVHSTYSSAREKVLEHLFIGELLRCLWLKGVHDVEVLRAEVDSAGYDLVLEGNGGVLRHVQLKSSHHGARTTNIAVNINLARKPSGCIIWLRFDGATLRLGPYLWFGGAPGDKLPPLGRRIGKHTKANSEGIKSERPNIRVLSQSQFKILASIDDVADALFGGPACGPELATSEPSGALLDDKRSERFMYTKLGELEVDRGEAVGDRLIDPADLEDG